MEAPTRRRRRGRLIPTLLATLGIGGSTLIIWTSSNAAFKATTKNETNSWSTGSVALTDNDSGSAMFTVNNLAPGGTGTSCIKVTYTGNVGVGVKLYGESLTAANALDQYITIKIEESTGAGVTSFGNCASFDASPTTLFNSTLNSFGTTKTSYATGVSSWAPSSNDSRDYRFTYTMDPAAPDSTQGSTATIKFVWEAQST